jgi:biofilm PGA synthesis N-glycosyltransferase PgaC
MNDQPLLDPARATRHQFVEAPVGPLSRRNSSSTFGRLIVGIVLAIVIAISALAAIIGRFYSQLTGTPDAPSEVPFIGDTTILVSGDLPAQGVVFAAIAGIIVIAFAAVSFEVIASLMSISPRRRLLTSLRPTPMSPADSPHRVIILIPAHNEEFSLPATLNALGQQSQAPDRVIVVADNCTDATVSIARDMGAECFETQGNRHKKGGALNQALAWLLPDCTPNDFIMVMDADTSLGPRYIEVAFTQFDADPELTAVGGVFFGEDGHGLIGQFQRNEYTRYSLQIRARRGRVFVLTGTASMFRSDALLDVAAARGVFIPGMPGQVYDTAALTEDNELTLALKSLGATMTSPSECTDTTELMPSWKALWIQRQRWQRGALENLSAYGITRATIRYWGQQIGIGYGTVALNSALLLMLITFISIDRWIWFPFWLAIGAVFLVERVITAWRGGWKARLLAAALLPELLYDVFLQIVFVKCLFDITFGRTAKWGHVQHAPSASAA